MPKRPKVWFGTLNDMRWIDAPVANFQSNSTGFNYSATTLRGDGFAKRSALTHREFTLTWAANTVAEHAALLYLLSTNELLYYVDPLAMKTNLLPGFMSHYTPNATVFTDDIPHVATPGAYNGAPAWSWNPAWIWQIGQKIHWPEGYKLWAGCRGDGTIQINDTAVTAVSEFDGRYVTTQIPTNNTSNPWGELQMLASSRISSICVRAYPETQVKAISDIPNNYGPFLPGMGYGALQQKEPYSIQEYSAAIDGYEVAVTATFVEKVLL